MNQKILPQLIAPFRGSALPISDQLEFALQALAWALLSQSDRLPEHLKLNPATIADQSRMISVLNELAALDDLMGQAFASSGQFAGEPVAVRITLDLALRLSEAGVLDRFDGSDAISLLPPHQWGGWSLPSEVASLLVDLGGLSSGETAYCGWDFGGQLAARVTDLGATAAIESPLRSAIPALVSLLADASFDIRFSDPIRAPSFLADGQLRKFDVAVAFPPMGRKYDLEVGDSDWFGRFPERTHSANVLAIRHLLAQARRRVVVALSNNLTFAAGAELRLRRELLSKGMIRSVIAMPAGLLEGPSIAFTVLVLDPSGGLGDVQFVTADAPNFREPVSKARFSLINSEQLIRLIQERVEGPFSHLVPTTEVLANDANLQAGRYVVPASSRELQVKLDASATIELGAVVTTVRPLPLVKEGPGVDVGEIGAADLPAYGYVCGPGRSVKVDPSEKNGRSFLRPLDIVLIVKGSVGKVGIVPPDVPPPGPGGWVAGQSAIVLRAEPTRVDPRALALQLRSKFGQSLLAQIVSGATIPLIQIRELMRLSILVPSLETASAAAEALEKERDLQQQAEAIQKQLPHVAAALWPEL